MEVHSLLLEFGVWHLVHRNKESRGDQWPNALSAGPAFRLLPNIKCFSFQIARHVSAIPWGVSASAALRPAASRRTCLTNVLWSGSGQAKLAFSTSKCYALV